MNPTFVYAVAVGIAAATLYGIARSLGRRDAENEDISFGPPTDIEVLSRVRLGRGRTLVVVEVEGKRMLLGSTSSQWTALADLGSVGATVAVSNDPFGPIDAELARAIQASRTRRDRN
jgi:flagellar biogenesis protein FliO